MTIFRTFSVAALAAALLAACSSEPDYADMTPQEIMDELQEDSVEFLAEAREVDTEAEANAFVQSLEDYAEDNMEVGEILKTKMEAMPPAEQMTFAMSLMGGEMMETSMGLATEMERISADFPDVAAKIDAVNEKMSMSMQ